MSIKLEGRRKAYAPKDADEIRCDIHNFVTVWGKLNAIQRFAVEEGIDTVDDLPCLLVPK